MRVVPMPFALGALAVVSLMAAGAPAASVADAPWLPVTGGHSPNVFFPDEPVALVAHCPAGSDGATLSYLVVGRDGRAVAYGDAQIVSRQATIALGNPGGGYYAVVLTGGPLGEGASSAAFVVVPRPGPRPAGERTCLFGLAGGTVYSDAEWEAMANLGVRHLRGDFAWPDWQPKQDAFDWTRTDRAVEMAQKHGIELLPILGYTPAWAGVRPETDHARARSATHTYPFRSNLEWKRAAEAMLGRYHDRVRLWELWNEVDLNFYYGPWERYQEMLKLTACVMRRTDPTNRLVYGGSDGTWTRSSQNSITHTDVYFDYGNAHYPWARGDWDPLGRHWGAEVPLGYYFDAQQVHLRNGIIGPVLVTEAAPLSEGLTEQEQTNATWEMLVQAKVANTPMWCCFPAVENYGRKWPAPMMRRDGHLVPKPVYAAYASVRDLLESTVAIGRLYSFGPDARAYLFRRGEENVLALWSAQGPLSATVALQPGARMQDVVGGQATLEGDEATLDLPEDEPRAIVGVSDAYLEPAARDTLWRLYGSKVGCAEDLEDGLVDSNSNIKYVRKFRDEVALSAGAEAGWRCEELMEATLQAVANGRPERSSEALTRLRAELLGVARVTVRGAYAERTRAHPRRDETYGYFRFGKPPLDYPGVFTWLSRLLQAGELTVRLQNALGDDVAPADAEAIAAARAGLDRVRAASRQAAGPYAEQARLRLLMMLTQDAIDRSATWGRPQLDLGLAFAELAAQLVQYEIPMVTYVLPTLEFPDATYILKGRRMAPGSPQRALVRVHNFADREAVGTIRLRVPEGWRCQTAPLGFSAPAGGESAELAFDVLVAPEPTAQANLYVEGQLRSGEVILPIRHAFAVAGA